MKVLLAIALATATASAYADCPYPQAPTKIPDGATATLEEMVAGQKSVGEYQKAINDYTACIDKELDDAIAKGGDKLKPDDKKKMQQVEAQNNNAAVNRLQTLED